MSGANNFPSELTGFESPPPCLYHQRPRICCVYSLLIITTVVFGLVYTILHAAVLIDQGAENGVHQFRIVLDAVSVAVWTCLGWVSLWYMQAQHLTPLPYFCITYEGGWFHMNFFSLVWQEGDSIKQPKKKPALQISYVSIGQSIFTSCWFALQATSIVRLIQVYGSDSNATGLQQAHAIFRFLHYFLGFHCFVQASVQFLMDLRNWHWHVLARLRPPQDSESKESKVPGKAEVISNEDEDTTSPLLAASERRWLSNTVIRSWNGWFLFGSFAAVLWCLSFTVQWWLSWIATVSLESVDWICPMFMLLYTVFVQVRTNSSLAAQRIDPSMEEANQLENAIQASLNPASQAGDRKDEVKLSSQDTSSVAPTNKSRDEGTDYAYAGNSSSLLRPLLASSVLLRSAKPRYLVSIFGVLSVPTVATWLAISTLLLFGPVLVKVAITLSGTGKF